MIGVVDYEAGNLRSVTNALSAINVPYVLSADRGELSACSGIILPGVGAAPGAMNTLRARRLADFLPQLKMPVLGICLGMQILFDRSEEGNTPCLGVIRGSVQQLPSGKIKIPHMGWNDVSCVQQSLLWEGLNGKTFFYFAHSYIVPVCTNTIAGTDCGIPFSAAVREKNFYGVQFHPEKSAEAGLRLLKNFDALCRSSRQ